MVAILKKQTAQMKKAIEIQKLLNRIAVLSLFPKAGEWLLYI